MLLMIKLLLLFHILETYVYKWKEDDRLCFQIEPSSNFGSIVLLVIAGVLTSQGLSFIICKLGRILFFFHKAVNVEWHKRCQVPITVSGRSLINNINSYDIISSELWFN